MQATRQATKNLWGNIYALMTDAVTKNLKVEEAVARELQTEHIPLHLLLQITHLRKIGWKLY